MSLAQRSLYIASSSRVRRKVADRRTPHIWPPPGAPSNPLQSYHDGPSKRPHPGNIWRHLQRNGRRGRRGNWIQGRRWPVTTRFRIRRFVLRMAQNLLPAVGRIAGNSVPDRLSRTAFGSLRACDLDRSQPAQTIASGLISPTDCAVSSRPASPANQPFAPVLR